MVLLSILNAALKQPLAAMSDRLKAFRHEFLPTDEEIENRYLDDAVDRYDLEMRMRELDRAPPRRGLVR